MILAGGKSSRMGRDKALLKIEAQSLLLRTVQVAEQLTNEVVVVTAHPQQYCDELPPTVRLVREANAQGPLKGMMEGWQHISAQWCLVLACDLPYLDPAALKSWWHWLTEKSPRSFNSDSATIASLVPGAKGWEPLCGYYHRRCITHLQAYIAAWESQTNSEQTNPTQANRAIAKKQARTIQKGQPSFQAWLSTVAQLGKARN